MGLAAIVPGPGPAAPSGEFGDPYLKFFDLTQGVTTKVALAVRIPVGPFCGTTGVPGAGMHDEPIPPPHAGGGNIDLRHLTAGSTLYLPVGVPGALLSLGDGHAAQGDGEVCVSTLECQVRTTIRVSIERSMSLRGGRCGLVGRSPGVACRTRAIVSETRRRVPRLRLSTN